MGIKGLFTELDARRCPTREVRLATMRHLTRIVVDGSFFMRSLYSPSKLDWEHGGDLRGFMKSVNRFVSVFSRARILLTVVVDGGIDPHKEDVWRKSRHTDANAARKLVEAIKAGESDPRGPPASLSSKLFVMPIGKITVAECFRAAGCEVIVSAGEADRELAEVCSAQRCYGVLTGDSDLLVMEGVPRVLLGHALDVYGKKSVSVIEAADAALSFGIPVALLPLFGVLMGNDFVSREKLSCLHARIERAFPGRPSTFQAVADFIAAELASGRLSVKDPASWLHSNPLLTNWASKLEESLGMYQLRSKPGADGSSSRDSRPDLAFLRVYASRTSNVVPPSVMAALVWRKVFSGVAVEDPNVASSWELLRVLSHRIHALLFSGHGVAVKSARVSLRLGEEYSECEELSDSSIYTASPMLKFMVGMPLELRFTADMFAPSLPSLASFRGRTHSPVIHYSFGRLVLFFFSLWPSVSVAELFARTVVHHPEIGHLLSVVAIAKYFHGAGAAVPVHLLRAFVLQAALIGRSSSNRVEQTPLRMEVVHFATVFPRAITAAAELNCACGFPISSYLRALMFDGSTFHFVAQCLFSGSTVPFERLWTSRAMYEASCVLADSAVEAITADEFVARFPSCIEALSGAGIPPVASAPRVLQGGTATVLLPQRHQPTRPGTGQQRPQANPPVASFAATPRQCQTNAMQSLPQQATKVLESVPVPVPVQAPVFVSTPSPSRTEAKSPAPSNPPLPHGTPAVAECLPLASKTKLRIVRPTDKAMNA